MSSMTRSWEWTPSPFANSVMSLVLRTPLLHRLVSRQILLFTFTGRKTGQRYTIPVGYIREGQRVTILTKWIRGWWRNFVDAAPVEVLVEGKTVRGTAKSVTDHETTLPLLTEALNKYPNQATFYGIRLITPNQPDMDDVREAASKLVAIQVMLVE